MIQRLSELLGSRFLVAEDPPAEIEQTETPSNHLLLSPYEERMIGGNNGYSGWVSRTHSPILWKAKPIAELDSAIYNLRMTHDQKTMLVGTQGSMNVFDCQNGIQLIASFHPHNITWTISDMDISDDSKFAISCSLNKYVTLYDLENTKVLTVFSMSQNQEDQDFDGYYGLRFYSCKMSEDKSALIGGSGSQGQGRALIQYFDTAKNKVLYSIPAHRDDINTIGFVHREQSTIILSGSDDGLVKVWDIRALGVSNKPVGILYGHRSGLTYVDTRNDGIYVCSNSKDQTLKLWDLRNTSSSEKEPQQLENFDYRYGKPRYHRPGEQSARQPNRAHTDNSVHTFTGHEVYRTLIRCHFSPKVTTNSDYIITGSHCGSCYIYSINEPSKPPINLDNHTETVKGFPMLDESDIEDKDEDYEPASMSDDEEDDRRSRTIIRDCVWNDSCIITGDWAERLKAYYPV